MGTGSFYFLYSQSRLEWLRCLWELIEDVLSIFTAWLLPPCSFFPSGCLIQRQSSWCLALKNPSEIRPCAPAPYLMLTG